MTLQWNGNVIAERVVAAQIFGVNATMSEAVIHAKQHHAWQNRTGILEGSLKIVTFAHRVPGEGVFGGWGSVDVKYAIVHELGSAKRNIPARPYLRPAADAIYPRLAANIRRGMPA